MENLTPYEDFSIARSAIEENYESMGHKMESAMSHQAMEALKQVCEGMLCKEAEDYHNDENEEHTYEGYVNECMGYIKEVMGNPGYATLVKPHAE